MSLKPFDWAIFTIILIRNVRKVLIRFSFKFYFQAVDEEKIRDRDENIRQLKVKYLANLLVIK